MSVKNCYVEEKINDSGGSNEVLEFEIEQNTEAIGYLQNDYGVLKNRVDADEKLIDNNSSQIAINSDIIQSIGTVYTYSISKWSTQEANQTNNVGGRWCSAFEDVDLDMTEPGKYIISVNFFASIIIPVNNVLPDITTVAIQLLQGGTSIATAYTGTHIISTSPVDPGNSVLVPCNISFPLTIETPILPLTMQVYINCDSTTQFQITQSIPTSTVSDQYWTGSMNISPVGFVSQYFGAESE